MPSNPLSLFYSVPQRWQLQLSGYVHVVWTCDPVATREIGAAGTCDLSSVSLTDLERVNDCVERWLSTDRTLLAVIVDRLYRTALAQTLPSRNNCWFNFIAAMTIKAARHTWQKIPRHQQSEQLLERLLTPTLSMQQLLAGFNPEYHPNLLVGLQAWTYQVVKYNSFADLRSNGNPYFGLSNLGIVSRSSYKLMRTALLGNITLDTLDRSISICKVFKNYLSRSQVNTNRLESTHWQEMLAEVRLLSIEIELAELCGQIDRVGGLIRAYHSVIVESADDPLRLTPLIDNSQQISPAADPEESLQIFDKIFTIIDAFIQSCPSETQKILAFRHHQQLTQSEIALLIAKDRTTGDWHALTVVEIKNLIKKYQPSISRQLGKIYLELLDCIHLQVSHPDGGSVKKNSQAIAAVEQLLKQYFRRLPPDLT